MIKIFFTLFCFGISINASHIHWLGDYDKALHKAQKEHKPLMVLLVQKSCPSCSDVIKEFFMEHEYVESLNKKFISVIVTYEGRGNYPIEMFYSTIFPTLFFVNSKTECFLSEPLYGKMIDENAIRKILKLLL